ncbi:glutathione S-transferase family protein [Burkholderia gladioli]|uniref:glutathione S-transferase family protein n=1 Tax=Burkholderia gladioli TaxID=28095 RepID=UPI001640D77E|nr:glutathione S-transferase N-terminal domain-containing protein [Burkholderia gladioli]MBJ9673464.1 glutathione S-transferase N-terminal domain-containing protein [Burkholderia gladioli]MDN7459533.1 glutathione S-transferase N-terminal domain-containing protein [Burkholderia gladioli]
MYQVYAFSTPNSVKVPIALEELGLQYELHSVNVRKGEQKHPDFIALNPNGKVPVLRDAERGFTLSESAAILVYLAERHGALLAQDPLTRARTFEQLFAHASGLSPAFGQAGYFLRFAPVESPGHALDRFAQEARRQLGLLDALLAGRTFVAGEDFSIADIAHFGWIWRRTFPDLTLDTAPNVQRWYDAVASRPAVERAIGRIEALAEGRQPA